MVGKFERRKDTVQVLAESAATHVGRIATIVSAAVRDLAHEIGEWTSDMIEMREAAAKAEAAERALTTAHEPGDLQPPDVDRSAEPDR